MSSDWVTFGLAFVAYALLCACVVAHRRGRPSRALAVLLAVVVTAHVGLVWGIRFGWSFSFALEKGIAGMVVFHAAFFMILGAAAAPDRWARLLHFASFAIATVGTAGAAFKHDYVALYRIPLLAAFAATVLLSLRAKSA